MRLSDDGKTVELTSIEYETMRKQLETATETVRKMEAAKVEAERLLSAAINNEKLIRINRDLVESVTRYKAQIVAIESHLRNTFVIFSGIGDGRNHPEDCFCSICFAKREPDIYKLMLKTK